MSGSAVRIARAVAVVGVAAVLAGASFLVVAIAASGSELAACAPPPRGYVAPGPSLPGLARLVGPALVVFLVGEYFALASSRRSVRVLASSLVAAFTVVVFEYSFLSLPTCGGLWA